MGICLALCINSPFASAQEEPSAAGGRIEIGLGRTDNLNRDAEELQADIATLAVGFVGRSDQRWVRASLAGDIELRKYEAEDPASDVDDVLGSVDGILELHAVPDRLLWHFRGSYGQARINPFGVTGPSNRQGTTSFLAGPEAAISLGERTLLRIDGSVSQQKYEVTKELDARKTGVRLGLERQIDSVTQLSIRLEGREVEYDIDSQIHDIATLSLEYQRELASGEALASIGRGRVEIDDGQSDPDPVTVGRLAWKRAVGARSRIEICAGREITDAGSVFENAGVAVGCPGDLGSLESVARTAGNREQGVVSTTNPLVRQGGSLSFHVDGELGNFRATISRAQDRFQEDSTFDNDSTVFEVSGSRDFAHYWRASLTARLWIQDFLDRGDKNEDQFVRVSLSRLLARGMRLTFSVEPTRRVAGFGEFDSNEYFLSIGRDFGSNRLH
jgi:hypothetical protein